MLQEKKLKTNIGVGIGFLLSVSQLLLAKQHYLSSIQSHILAWIGIGFLVWGCMNYALGKGYSKWFGLLGILSFIGFAVLVFMPDKHKQNNK